MKGLLVDFDGTLVDLPTNYEKMRAELQAVFGNYGRNRTFRPLLESLEAVRNELIRDGLSRGEVTLLMERSQAIMTRHEVRAARHARPRPGAREFLEFAKKRGMRIAIVTNNSRAAVETAFRFLRLSSPEVIVARGEASGFKPAAAPAVEALRMLRIRPGEVLLVGDDERDYEMGRAAGVRTLLVGGKMRGAPRVAGLSEVIALLGPSS